MSTEEWKPTGKWERVDDDDILLYHWGQCSGQDLANRYYFMTSDEIRETGPPILEGTKPIEKITEKE